jgi:hypothetical protein
VWEWVFVREIDIGADYSFLIQGYKPAYLFWETLDMVRKVLMVGVVVLVGRGSVMQLVMGATVTFSFFSAHAKLWPYRVEQDNIFRATTEAHLFITVMGSFVLRENMQMQMQQGAFDYLVEFLLSIAFVFCVPVAFVYVIVKKFSDTRRIAHGSDTEAAFKWFQIGLGSDDDHAILTAYFEKVRQLEDPTVKGKQLWLNKQLVSHLNLGQMQAALVALEADLLKSEALGFHFTNLDSARLILQEGKGIRASKIGQLGGGVSICLTSPVEFGWDSNCIEDTSKEGFVKRVGDALWGRCVHTNPPLAVCLSLSLSLPLYCLSLFLALARDFCLSHARSSHLDDLLARALSMCASVCSKWYEVMTGEPWPDLEEQVRSKAVKGNWPAARDEWGSWKNKLEVLLIVKIPTNKNDKQFVPGRPSIYILPQSTLLPEEDGKNVVYSNANIVDAYVLKPPQSGDDRRLVDAMAAAVSSPSNESWVEYSSARDQHGGISKPTVAETDPPNKSKQDILDGDVNKPWTLQATTFTACVGSTAGAESDWAALHEPQAKLKAGKDLWVESVARFTALEMEAALASIDSQLVRAYSLAFYFTTKAKADQMCEADTGGIPTDPPLVVMPHLSAARSPFLVASRRAGRSIERTSQRPTNYCRRGRLHQP